MSGRKPSETSVATIVGLLPLGETVKIENKSLASCAVMVSTLKRKPEQADKKFKVKQVEGVVVVTRVK